MTKPSDKEETEAPELEAAEGPKLGPITAFPNGPGVTFGARLRNYFLTGLIIVGPVTITLYIVWSLINIADAWIKPLLPERYLPEAYLPFAVPGIGLLVGIVGLMVIGALAANLLGRTLISFGVQMLDGMPIVRNVHRGLRQVFEGVLVAAGPNQSFQKVGLIQFPSKGLWSLVFVTSEKTGEINIKVNDAGEDLIAVFMPTGVVPPTGFICFVPRKNVTILDMTAEDAAKIILSAGMVVPDYQARLAALGAGAVPPKKPKA
ncbi:conserved protein of unknown function [Candidatus Filomicrobium marinum]|uniref:DUF502 domain-containing protein n=2 Tax=Filomicrobium TaxID=119044 RepID=A0A0D6JIN2_9HYPH|nr:MULTISPECIES: DUF502 domain-containing protein [Filomicrobium]MCV0371407.1 DUF502 domain-containing protein [Filomicrobium sp.]CFX35193.1 conserved protein of unknown function [Candidatus Filomicrobium marinum]CPR21818.1 conserved protein of unknown function [Candidatus Filomicrobium marinum]SDP51083.1 Uncharacterized membrane protein [Filomicrobium insigne]